MQKRKGIKVFLFLTVGVLLLLALCFQFAKTGSWFKPSYALELQSENIGGIRPGADVLMAGIREKMAYNDIPPSFKGMPIVLISSALMAIAFTGFSGLK